MQGGGLKQWSTNGEKHMSLVGSGRGTI